jgi:lipoyl-dependent peroxiredoxin
MIRKAKAVWRGTGRAGTGHLSTDSGVLAEAPYSFRTRFENEKGTNPEELIAAAHAGCFTMALAFGLQAGGYTPTELTTEAAVTLEPEGQGFRISRSCAHRCPTSTKLRLLEWPAMPRRTVQFPRCLAQRSRWMQS